MVHIKNESETKVLSAAQKKFNSLIKKIDGKKKLLLEWQETIPRYRQRLDSEYEQSWEVYNNHRVTLVNLLDNAYHDKLFKKTDKAKIEQIIVDISLELIAEHDYTELKDLYNKYSDSDFDSDQQEQQEAAGQLMKEMLEGMFGLDIGDELDFSSPEKMQAAVQEKMLQHHEHLQEQQRRLEEKRASRKKTAKQLEKEARQQEEEKNLSKSIQEVFRKLAAVLHPDREQDAQEKERKTKIMQQVNVAYAKKDLLRLLELQLEFEHIDQAHLNNIAADRLKYFNKILQEQLGELEQEIMQIEMPFKMQLEIPPFLSLTPTKLLAQLEFDIKDVQHDISRLEADLVRFQVPANLKTWLKTYGSPKKSSNPLDDFFLE
jgi:hypothetical protein